MSTLIPFKIKDKHFLTRSIVFWKEWKSKKIHDSDLIIVVTPATVWTLEVTWYTKHNTIYKVHNIAATASCPHAAQ